MLERARATSLALLGATAAVGLGIVALALNQGWPLLEGAAIPAAPKQAIGSASVVARPPAARPGRPGAAHRRGGGPPGRARSAASAHTHATVEAPSGGEEAAALVVSQGTPASAPAATPPKTPPKQGKAPAGDSQPAQPPAAQSPAAPTAAPSPPAPAPAPAPTPTQPEAVTSEAAPDESNVPSWSNGRGHAYGRDEGRPGADDHGRDHGDASHDPGHGD